MKTSIWIVIVVVAFFLGCLVGFSLSPTNPPDLAGAPPAAEKAQ